MGSSSFSTLIVLPFRKARSDSPFFITGQVSYVSALAPRGVDMCPATCFRPSGLRSKHDILPALRKSFYFGKAGLQRSPIVAVGSIGATAFRSRKNTQFCVVFCAWLSDLYRPLLATATRARQRPAGFRKRPEVAMPARRRRTRTHSNIIARCGEVIVSLNPPSVVLATWRVRRR
jgi:hypothetical protein